MIALPAVIDRDAASRVTGSERPSDGRHGLVFCDVLLDVLRVTLRLEVQGRTSGTGRGEVVGTGLGLRRGGVDEGGIHAELEVHRVVLAGLGGVGHDVERGLLRHGDAGDVDAEIGAVDDLQCARGGGGQVTVSAHGERDDRRHRHRQVGVICLDRHGRGLVRGREGGSRGADGCCEHRRSHDSSKALLELRHVMPLSPLNGVLSARDSLSRCYGYSDAAMVTSKPEGLPDGSPSSMA